MQIASKIKVSKLTDNSGEVFYANYNGINYVLTRAFESRNIHMKEGQLWIISLDERQQSIINVAEAVRLATCADCV